MAENAVPPSRTAARGIVALISLANRTVKATAEQNSRKSPNVPRRPKYVTPVGMWRGKGRRGRRDCLKKNCKSPPTRKVRMKALSPFESLEPHVTS
jgi:hypothetical protein